MIKSFMAPQTIALDLRRERGEARPGRGWNQLQVTRSATNQPTAKTSPLSQGRGSEPEEWQRIWVLLSCCEPRLALEHIMNKRFWRADGGALSGPAPLGICSR